MGCKLPVKPALTKWGFHICDQIHGLFLLLGKLNIHLMVDPEEVPPERAILPVSLNSRTTYQYWFEEFLITFLEAHTYILAVVWFLAGQLISFFV